jgi:hypothetical protein
LRPGRTDTHTPCRFRLLVFTHDAARGTNDFLWGIFCLQNPAVRAGFRSRNPTVRAGSASQLKRETVVGRTDARTHTHVVIIYKIMVCSLVGCLVMGCSTLARMGMKNVCSCNLVGAETTPF